MFERTVLPDGPRVISARVPGARSLSVAAYVLAGSRSELPGQGGVAHFMEHLTFKGTRAFPTTRAVAEAVEGLGGTCNAATDRESTVYWARLPMRHAARGFEMLAELIVRPQLRDADIARERDIVIEEIRSYRDDPAQFVFNLFDEAFFGDTPLGREIAGDEASVAGLTGRQVRSFWSLAYQPGNLVVAAVGELSHRDVVALTDSTFGRGKGMRPGFEPAPRTPRQRLKVLVRPGAQAHLCLGLPALPRDDPEQWTLELLNTVLGEGSSSRLFQRVRERAGLAYDVHSFPTDQADCGTLQVYAGVDPANVEPALAAILAELARMRDRRVAADELERARAFASGRLELRLEETRNLCAWLGTQEALHDRVMTLEEALAALAAVTAQDIQRLAARLLRDELLTLAVITPVRHSAGLERALRLP